MCLAVSPHEQGLPKALVSDRNKRNRPRSQCNGSASDNSISDTSSVSSSSVAKSSSSLDNDSPTVSRKPRRRNRGPRKKTKKVTQTLTPEVKLSAQEQGWYIAMDCEMVGSGKYGQTSVLARVTLVDWNGRIIYDAYISPEVPVTDYRTFVSGITEDNLKGAGSFDTCRAEVLELLQGKVLVGHALKNDLYALDIRHPWSQTRDTGKYEPFMKTRYDNDVLWPRKLKELVSEKLHRDIQTAGVAHCPIEDAVAALDLYKSVRAKWEKVMDYKISKTRQIEQQHQQQAQ